MAARAGFGCVELQHGDRERHQHGPDQESLEAEHLDAAEPPRQLSFRLIQHEACQSRAMDVV